MAVVTGPFSDTTAIVYGHRRGVELRTTGLGTWYLVPDDGQVVAGVLAIHGQHDLAGLVRLTRRLAELQLPGVAPVYDLVGEAGHNWLLVRSAPGPTLAELTVGGAIDPDSVLTVARDTGAALLAMHRHGLAHGNISEHSVIVNVRGVALLLDWTVYDNSPYAPRHTAADDVRDWAQLLWTLACDWCRDDFLLGIGLARVAGMAIGMAGLHSALEELDRMLSQPPRAWLAEQSTLWLSWWSAMAEQDPADRADTEIAWPTGAAHSLLSAPDPVEEHSTNGRDGGPLPLSADVRLRDEIDLARLTARAARPRRRPYRTLLWSLIAAAGLAAAGYLALVVVHPPELAVKSVSVHLERVGSECTVVGTIVTNGLPGTLAYRWSGDTPPLPAQTRTLSEKQSAIQVRQRWAEVRAASDSVDVIAALELIEPVSRRAFIELSPDCQ